MSETAFEGAAAVELVAPALRLVAVTAYGPRIAFFGRPDGENLLLWEPGRHVRGDWDLRGGHRVWFTRPGADESEECYRPDNEAADVEVFDDGFAITGAVDPVTRTRRGFSVRALSGARVEVENFVVNAGDMLTSGGVWALTCTVPKSGTRYRAPLGDGSAWDAFPVVYFKRWGGGHAGLVDDPQFRLTEKELVVDPRGYENKRMFLAAPGILSMSDPARGVTFAKRSVLERAGSYPKGCNAAFYVGPENFMVEMETMGPEIALAPGERAVNREEWVLAPGAVDDARSLFG